MLNFFITSYAFMDGSLLGIGIAILILNNGLAGIGNVVVSKTAAELPPLVLSSFSMIVGGAILYLFALPIEGFAHVKTTGNLECLGIFNSISWI